MSFFKKLFGKKKTEEAPPPQDPFSQEQYDKDYEDKLQGLEHVLGKMHGMVGHAIIPFSIGGAVDMYYFPHHITGTGFVTMELLDPDGNGPAPNVLGTYELLAFTKEPINDNREITTPFDAIERRFCGIFTMIGNYSPEAVLNPGETCEIPSDKGPNKCIVFDRYRPEGRDFNIGDREHHLLLIIEVFASELAFARQHGSAALLDRLREAGHYPYSDLDREAVA